MKIYLILIWLILIPINLLSQNDSVAIREFAQSESVSIINLIANPEKYYNKRVSIRGYYINDFEGTAIYLNREDYEHNIDQNSIFLILNYSDFQFLHKEYITVDGIFIKGNGHMGLFGGMLKDINVLSSKYHE